MTEAPKVTAVSISSDPGSDDTYGVGDEITVDVTFDSELDVTGTPRLSLISAAARNANLRWADYDAPGGSLPHRIWKQGFLRFKYTVRPGDEDTDGITVDKIAFIDFIVATGASIRKHCSGDVQEDAACEPGARNTRTSTLPDNLKIEDAMDHKVATPPGAVPDAPDLTNVQVSASGQTLSFHWVSQADSSRRG